MKCYVVMEVIYRHYPPRVQQQMSRLERRDEAMWWFALKDIDREENTTGYLTTFIREDAARKYFQSSKGKWGHRTSVYLVYGEALTRKGAVQRALGVLVGGYKRGEVLDQFHRGPDPAYAQEAEVEHGSS